MTAPPIIPAKRPPTAGASPGSRRRPFSTRKGLTILLFLAPAAIFIGVFTYFPILSGSRMAFQEWNLWDLTETPWVGLDNFHAILSNPIFWTVAGNSVIWVVGSIIPQLVIGFGLALLMRKWFRGRGIYQALVFYPWAVSGFLIGILFRWMFNAEFGVINDMLRKTGLTETNIAWLADADLALIAVLVANIWYGVTFFAIMILAALQSVDESMLEAAEIDGAGKARTLFSIMIPAIRQTLLLTILLRVIWIFNFPDIIWAMTGGGPAGHTHIVTTWMIEFTQQGNYGVASALGLICVTILLIFSVFYLLASREKES
ncbi:carbohydrate ABC transporter permease [Pseudactinotalea sp. Z1748]|uniref:carbohydrate ABC transporter permease n=1 Tax=Pseudactinotalea sp. Z1748 TaxID=3413027 RepID=UPI003C7C9B48